MRTLKTISVILPMTLLLACGGGAGYPGSAHEPTHIIPVESTQQANDEVSLPDNPTDEEVREYARQRIQEELQKRRTPPLETKYYESLEIVRKDLQEYIDGGGTSQDYINGQRGKIKKYEEVVRLYTEWYEGGDEELRNEARRLADSPSVPTNDPAPYAEYLSFGDWDAHSSLTYGVHPETGNLTTRRITPNGPIDSTFDGAEYNGNSVVKRTDDEYISGDVRASLSQNDNGNFKIKFEFSNMDDVLDVDHTISDYNPNNGPGFQTSDFKHSATDMKGLRGVFSGRDSEHVVGAFGGEEIQIGVFGAKKD